MTKHDAIIDYFAPELEALTGMIAQFNHEAIESGSVSIETIDNDRVLKKYIRAAKREYRFKAVFVLGYSTYCDTVNVDAMNLAQSFMDWLEDQNRTKTFPTLPNKREGKPDCIVTQVETLQNIPALTGIDADEKVARYEIPCRVVYYEED